MDISMLELFRAEIEIHTAPLNEGLLALEKDPSQTKRLEALMRAAHSIKGAARIVGVDPAVQLAHVMEDSFVAAQAGRLTLTSEIIDGLLRGVDLLAQIAQVPVEQLNEWLVEKRPTFDNLVKDITALRSGPRPAAIPKAEIPAAPALPAESSPRSPAKIALSEEGLRRTVRPQGNIDAATAEELRLLLRDVLGQEVAQVRFDLANVQDVEPVGLAVLAVFARLAQERQPPAALQVVNAGPDLQTLLRLTRLDRSYRLPTGDNRA